MELVAKLQHPHAMCLTTDYCMRCGASGESILLERTECLPVDTKVTAISHVRAKSRMASVCGDPNVVVDKPA